MTDARDVIARAICERLDLYPEALSAYQGTADAVVAALAAAGLTIAETPTSDPVADLNRMADGREQYLHGAARNPRTAADLDALNPWDRDLWTEVQTWRQAARLAGGDRELLYSMPSWCWSDEMVKALHEPKKVTP